MIYEQRIYRCMPGRLPALLKRFENHTLKIWEKHGIKQAGFWTVLVGDGSHDLHYMLAWELLADREKKWNAFQADPAWHQGPRRQREGRADHCQYHKLVPAADGVFCGEVERRRLTGPARAIMVAREETMTAKPNAIVTVGKARFGNALPLALIAGPCVLESRAHAFEMASALKEIAARLGIGFVYKTSFDKANRTSAKSARGIGLDKALAIFAELREKLGVPVLTDVHEPDQCAAVAEVVDILQIPAFLCRQTDLLIAAAKTGRAST